MHIVQKAADSCEYTTRSYSGRGMGGKYCLGVEADDLHEFLADIMEYSYEDDGDETIMDVAEAVRHMKTDSLGRHMIIYFPRIEFSSKEVVSSKEP